jgi:hypothetical protein
MNIISTNNYRGLTLSGVSTMIHHIITNYDGAAAHVELDALRDALLPDVAPMGLLYILKARTIVREAIPAVPSMADAVAFDF